MKFFIITLLSFLSYSIVSGQAGTTIDFEDSLGDVVLVYDGLVNGKHSYTETVTNDDITVSWTGSRWEVTCNGCGPAIYHSDEVTALNPPNFAVGNWQDTQPGDGVVLIALSGSGTTGTLLPVEFIDFNVRIVDSKSFLNWVTASENNNKGFEVERSIDGNSYHQVGYKEGQENSLVKKEYQFVDENLERGMQYYYRLKQIDYSGEFAYSKIISVKTIGKEIFEVTISPNPARDFLNIEYESTNKMEMKVSIFDTQGRLAKSVELIPGVRKQSLDLNILSLQPGTYLLKIQSEESISHEMFIKK